MAKNNKFEVGFVFGAKKAASFDKTFSGINQSISGIVKGIAGIAAGYVSLNAIKGAINTYADFEQSVANVAAISGATGEELEALEQKALDMGKATSKTAKEAADALGYMALAGWDAQTSMDALEPVLRLSEAGGMDLARTSDLVTDSMSALSMEAHELPGYLDMVAQTARKSNTDMDALMEAFIGVGGTLSSLNVPLEESNAALGVLANRGMKGSEAGTALSSLMTNLTSGAGQAGKAMEELGISAFDSNGEFKGIEATLMEVNEATKDLSDEQRSMYFSMIGGKSQIKTLNNLMAGLNTTTEEGISEFAALRGEILDSNGVLMDMAAIQNNTMTGAFARAQSAIDDFKINAIKKMEPYITPVINWFAEKLPEATEKFAAGLGFVADRFGDLINFFRGGGAVSAIEDFFGFDAGTLQKTAEHYANTFIGGMRKVLSGDMSGAADILGLMGFDDKSIQAIQGYVETVGQGFLKLGGYVKPMAQTVVGAFQSIQPTMQKIMNFFTQTMLPIWQSVFGFIVDKVVPPFVQFFQENIPKVANTFSNLWDIARPIFQNLADKFTLIWTVAQPIISAILEGVFGLASGLMTALEGITGFIGGVFSGDWAKAWQGVKDIFSGIVSGLDSLFRVPINAIVGLINKVIGGINGLSIDIPDWVPFGLGGKSLGFSIPEIPALAQGGVATAPTLAMVGEGKESEAILPLSKLDDLLQQQPADNSIPKLDGLLQQPADGSMTIVFSPILPYLQAIVEGMRQEKGIPRGETPPPQVETDPPDPGTPSAPVTPFGDILEELIKRLKDDPPPKPTGGAGGGSSQFVFAPVYHIHGNASKEDLEQVTEMSYEKFKEYYERVQWEEERTTIKK